VKVKVRKRRKKKGRDKVKQRREKERGENNIAFDCVGNGRILQLFYNNSRRQTERIANLDF
jgi:hypothetical protein